MSRLSNQLTKNYRNFLTYNINNVVEQFRSELQMRFPTVKKFEGWVNNFQSGMRMMGCFIGKECSPIFAQRVFRSYRVLQLHSKLWSKQLNALQGHGGRPLSKRALLSFLIFSMCQSNNKIESIRESELVEHMKDLDFIHELTAATVVCPDCRDRLVVDKKVPTVKYCHCPGASVAYDRKIDGYSWIPFVETPDLLIWRMPHPERPGLYMYKVYGYYDDISPEEFLDTQLDINYRKKWDDTVLKLDIIESDKENKQDFIYWEMKWPTMFSNRDYLFARRHFVDRQQQSLVILSKAVPHHSVPERKGIHRVKEYWSVMHVKAVKGLSDPGVEFGLTYFDNPGVSLPGWLNNWAAMTAIPDFLNKQRNATRAKKLAQQNKSKTVSQSHCSDHKDQEAGGPPKEGGKQPADENNNSHIDEQNKSITGSDPTPKTEILSQYFKENYVLQQNLQ